MIFSAAQHSNAAIREMVSRVSGLASSTLLPAARPTHEVSLPGVAGGPG